jgi:hypothetical protein
MKYYDGKRTWNLPQVIFINGEFKFYKVIGFQNPKKGEWFLSGAIPEAYQATNDLSQEYLVIETTETAYRKSIWVKKEEL